MRSTFSDVCTVGCQLPGPKPLLLFDDPWLAETFWDSQAKPPYRDRKGQVWARCAGAFDIYMYYAQQETFDWPEGIPAPKVGEAVPWLSYLDRTNGNPQPWRWTAGWTTGCSTPPESRP